MHQRFAAVVALLASVLSFSGTDATTDQWCSCQPSSYEFKLNFANTCVDTTLPETNGVVDFAGCAIVFDDQSIVKVTTIAFTEVLFSDHTFHQYVAEEELFDGDSFTYEFQTETPSKGIWIVLIGVDEIGDTVTSPVLISFEQLSSACAVEDPEMVGETVGWLEIVSCSTSFGCLHCIADAVNRWN
jgi:hypothetical protein